MTPEPPTMPERLPRGKPALSIDQMEQIAELSETYLQCEAVEFSDDCLISNLRALCELSLQKDNKISRRHARQIGKLAIAASAANLAEFKMAPHRQSFARRVLMNVRHKPVLADRISELVEKTGSLARKYDDAGVERILLELETPKLAAVAMKRAAKNAKRDISALPPAKKVAEQYSMLVDAMADILANDLGIKPDSGIAFSKDMQEHFICEAWALIKCNLRTHHESNTEVMLGLYGDMTLAESMVTNRWDCDNTAFLVFDVAKRLGLSAMVLMVPETQIQGHVLVSTGDYLFETSLGGYYAAESLEERYPRRWGTFSSSTELQAITYYNRSITKFGLNDFQGAVADCEESIQRTPNALAYFSMGRAKSALKDFQGAVIAYGEAIRLDPEYADAYFVRSMVRANAGDRQGELEDAEKFHMLSAKAGSGTSAPEEAYRQKADSYAIERKFNKAGRNYELAASLASDYEKVRLFAESEKFYVKAGDRKNATNAHKSLLEAALETEQSRASQIKAIFSMERFRNTNVNWQSGSMDARQASAKHFDGAIKYARLLVQSELKLNEYTEFRQLLARALSETELEKFERETKPHRLDGLLSLQDEIMRHKDWKLKALEELYEAYSSDNQTKIGETINTINEKEKTGQLPLYEVVGTSYGGHLYTNIFRSKIAEGGIRLDRNFLNSPAHSESVLSPEQYADRLGKILKEGFKTSGRELRPGGAILGVSHIHNLFGYFEPLAYTDDFSATVRWKPDGYCLLEYHGGGLGRREGIVFSPHSVRPSEMTILLKKPENAALFGENEWIKKLANLLEERGIPFEYI